MAKQITHVSIFLASPSDLGEERRAVKQAVDELNGIVRQTMNVHLDLLTWETDAYPSAGIDAQDVINSQIGDNYDIFIGMMWQRFGTATGRAGSGTEEEFERAYKKFVETSGRTKIMLYFSSKPISPDDIDFNQLAKVRDFKNRAQQLGILHWSFNDAESFQKILKMHLTKHLPEVISSFNNPISKPIVGSTVNNIFRDDSIITDNDVDGEDENGYFDLMEIFSENFSQVEKVLAVMASYIDDLGQQMQLKAAKFDALNKSPNRSTHSYRLLIDSSAADIMNYVNLTNIELPRFHDLFTSGIDALSNALTVSETNGNNIKVLELEELLEAIFSAKSNVEGATTSINGMRESASGFPSIAKNINKAARLLRTTLSSVINEFENSTLLLDNLSDVITSILSRMNGGDSSAEEI